MSKDYLNYDHKRIESQWQKKWKSTNLYAADNKKSEKYYSLVELTYSSGDLHIGHWFSWTAPDVFARFQRMRGKNVLFPVGGFDSFGLPAENAAIKHSIHPRDWTNKNIKNMRKQFSSIGPSFDWKKEVITSEPGYYRWTQWLFLQLYKNNLAYRAKALSNWCPKCQTVLANEHVVNGCCWRHTDTVVLQRQVDQWFFRITKYADRLIWPEKPKVDWPQSIIEGHNKWIGKKEGITITYKVGGTKETISCWTSRPDTNFGATFIVLAPDHPQVLSLTTKQNLQSVKKYIEIAKKRTQRERLIEAREKTGQFTGSYAINDLNGQMLPIWISDFVLMEVGSGAVVGVPGHDRRDFEFAKKFHLPVKRVVIGKDGNKSEIFTINEVQEEEGRMVNSGFLDGLDIHEATTKIMDYLEKKGWGKRKTYYHLRDWSISRQRYWGAPVPIIYCNNCWQTRNSKDLSINLKEGIDYAILDDGVQYIIHPVPEKDLPVNLPYKVDYTPTGKPPLATSASFIKTKCPVCGKYARRETETLDTYVDSAWYFLRYPTPSYNKGPFDPKFVNDWLPLEVYFGGSEHILGHTLYARFITKVLHDLGYLKFDEFAKKRINHGIILGPDGYRMSKSRGNVVNPDIEVEKYGGDAVRVYLCFMGPHEQGAPWSREGIEGTHRFLKRVWNLLTEYKDLVIIEKEDALKVLKTQHKVIQKVTKDIEGMHFNTAVAALMEFLNLLYDKVGVNNSDSEKSLHRSNIRCAEWDAAVETLVLLLAPFAPHITEELWVNVLKKDFSVHKQPWPKFDPDLIKEEKVTIPVQVNGKLRGTIVVDAEESENKVKVVETAKNDDKIAKWLSGEVKKVIFVPRKLLNFVVGEG